MAHKALLLPGQHSLSTFACLPVPPKGGGGDWSAGGGAHLGFPPVTVESFLC